MAAPKPKPKPAPTPVKKATTPGAKAAALQQAAATKQFRATQARTAAAAQRTGYVDPTTNRMTIRTRGGITRLPAKTRASAAPAPSRGGPAPRGTQNPLEHLLTPAGNNNVQGAMATGTMKNNPLKRILGGR